MSDLICRKSMLRCQTPGMCSPHGGCGPSVLIDTSVRYSNVSAGQGAEWTEERKLALTTALRLVASEEENARLKAECEGLRKVMACVVSEVPRYTHRDGNAPGHCHSVPGIWDSDNGAKAGTECGWCKVWNAAVAMSKEASNG